MPQDRHNTKVAIREPTPVDEVPFVAEKVTLNAEPGGMGLEGVMWVAMPLKASNKPVI
jgi:hypothetical protein